MHFWRQMASKQPDSPISPEVIAKATEDSVVALVSISTNESTSARPTCQTDTKNVSPIKGPSPSPEKLVTREKPDHEESSQLTQRVTSNDSNLHNSDSDQSDQPTQVLLFEETPPAPENHPSSSSRKVRTPQDSYEFGASKRPEKPLGLLSGGTFLGHDDDTDQFEQCTHCPTRSRKNASHCPGCSMPKDGGMHGRKKQWKINSPYGFQLKYFFGGSLPPPSSPKN